MSRKKPLFLCAVACLLAQSARADTEAITIAADLWCPVNCEADGDRPGIGVELARQVFEPLGYRVNYVIMPWSRALEEARAGKIDAVVGANVNDDPSLVYPKHPIIEITDDFYTLEGAKFSFNGIQSLKGRRVGVIADYGYGDAVKSFLAEARKTPGLVQETGGDDALAQNIRKLLAGRIDVIIESRAVMEYALARPGGENRITRIGGVPQGYVYLAFSPTRPESAARAGRYDEGIARLKKSGALARIYARYGTREIP